MRTSHMAGHTGDVETTTETPTAGPGPRSAPPTVGSSPDWMWLLAGLLAGVLGLLAARWSTSLLSSRVDPVQAMAERVVDVTPGPVAEALIALVGQNDKPFLVAGITVVALLATAYAGLLARTRRTASLLVLVVLALLAAAAVLGGRGAGVRDLMPVLLGFVTWVVVLELLTRPLLQARWEGHEPALTRRRFLSRVGLAVLLGAVVGVGGQMAASGRSQTRRVRQALSLPGVTRGTVPAGVEVGVAGVTPWRVSNDAFYRIDTAIVLPDVSIADWQLRIHGMVDREVVLTYDDLRRGDLVEDWTTICCVSNEVGGDLIGNAWWSGVRIAPILARLGVSSDADAVLQTSQDGWTCGTPLEALTDDRNAMLAIAMNGEPLPVEHGFPVRMIVPGLFGYVSATKWITDIEVTRFDRFQAFWTERGWTERGPVKTMSRIDVPRYGEDFGVGAVRVGGVAWAQQTGIAAVEYQLDGGPWTEATLARVPNLDTWVQWAGSVDLAAGEHTLRVRATDESGYTQTPVKADVYPGGATGWDERIFIARA